MRLAILLLASSLISMSALATKPDRPLPQPKPHYDVAIRNPGGVQIQGSTNINANQLTSHAIATGQGNTARNTAGTIKGGTQIQGNTNIKAAQKGGTAVAQGRNNNAGNQAGVIGGN